ncbi:MAG: CHASE2 domain-containing protein, partial [Betaproteobacteria bacterium]
MRLRRSRANAPQIAPGNTNLRARLPPVWIHGLIVGAALALFGCLLALPSAFWPLQEKADLAILFSLRPAIKPPDDIVLVTIDPQSAQRLSLPRNSLTSGSCAGLHVGDVPASHERLPPPHLVMRWPRCVHALAVDALAAAGASVIALDISFRPLNPDAPDKCSAPERPNNELLAHAISAAGNVIIAQWMDPIRSGPVATAGGAVADSMHRPAQIDPLIESSALGAAPLRLIYGMSGRVNGFALFSEEETPISS